MGWENSLGAISSIDISSLRDCRTKAGDVRTMIIEGLGEILSSSRPHSCFANSRLLAVLTPRGGCRVHAFTFFQVAKKLEIIACRGLDEARTSGGFSIYAYVIMPDHIHVITNSILPPLTNPILERLEDIHNELREVGLLDKWKGRLEFVREHLAPDLTKITPQQIASRYENLTKALTYVTEIQHSLVQRRCENLFSEYLPSKSVGTLESGKRP